MYKEEKEEKSSVEHVKRLKFDQDNKGVFASEFGQRGNRNWFGWDGIFGWQGGTIWAYRYHNL